MGGILGNIKDMTNCAEEKGDDLYRQRPECKYTLLANFILIYNGVLLSLSIRMISDEFTNKISQMHIWEFFVNPDYSIVLAVLTLLLFLDDIIRNTVFVSIYPYRATSRFLLDILFPSSFYFSISMAINGSKYYLVGIFFILFLTIIWSRYCVLKERGIIAYHELNKVANVWGLILTCITYFLVRYYIKDDLDKMYWYFIFLSGWLFTYNFARVIKIERTLCFIHDTAIDSGLFIKFCFYLHQWLFTSSKKAL